MSALECLVHLDPYNLPPDYVWIKINVPDDIATETFNGDATDPLVCLQFGDEWLITRRTAVLIVPSAVLPQERNVLINPNHPDASRVSIGEVRDFEFDERLFKTK
jgi:RES domain-containing protein